MTSSSLTVSKIQPCSLLIIGHGSDLQGDDAVGAWVAKTVADWQLPSVESLAVPRLTPELAADMAQANYVIFVDACGESCALTIQLEPIVVTRSALSLCTDLILPDNCEPSALLALVQTIYQRHPQAWTIQIPTECFDLGKSFSDTACRGCDRALRTIEQFFRTYLSAPCIESA